MTCEDECCCGGHNEEFETEEVEENREVDILEFDLDEDEINELVEKLVELKETKSSLRIEIDDDNDLLINYGGDSEESDEDEEDEE